MRCLIRVQSNPCTVLCTLLVCSCVVLFCFDRVRVSSASAEDDLLRLGYLGRGAGGVVYKALHLPTLRICAVKVVPVHDSKHREQMVSEMKALRQNFVSWNSAATHTCAGCGNAEHEMPKHNGTSRSCVLCSKFFCGTDHPLLLLTTCPMLLLTLVFRLVVVLLFCGSVVLLFCGSVVRLFWLVVRIVQVRVKRSSWTKQKNTIVGNAKMNAT
jgi:hypothetical protein